MYGLITEVKLVQYGEPTYTVYVQNKSNYTFAESELTAAITTHPEKPKDNPEREIVPGSIIRLKTGDGPKMVVKSVVEDICVCVFYLDDLKFMHIELPCSLLTII